MYFFLIWHSKTIKWRINIIKIGIKRDNKEKNKEKKLYFFLIFHNFKFVLNKERKKIFCCAKFLKISVQKERTVNCLEIKYNTNVYIFLLV